MLSGIDGVLLVVVVGEGKLVVPVDFAIRRPDPQGPGGPCRDKLHWVESMLDGRVAAFRRRGVTLPPPMVVADSWFSDSKLMRQVAITHGAPSWWKGKARMSSRWQAGARSRGRTCSICAIGPGVTAHRHRECVVLRLRATSPTYGAVTIIVVDKPGEDQFYVMCLDTAISRPRLMQA